MLLLALMHTASSAFAYLSETCTNARNSGTISVQVSLVIRKAPVPPRYVLSSTSRRINTGFKVEM